MTCNPIVALHRAVAVAVVDGPTVGPARDELLVTALNADLRLLASRMRSSWVAVDLAERPALF